MLAESACSSCRFSGDQIHGIDWTQAVFPIDNNHRMRSALPGNGLAHHVPSSNGLRQSVHRQRGLRAADQSHYFSNELLVA